MPQSKPTDTHSLFGPLPMFITSKIEWSLFYTVAPINIKNWIDYGERLFKCHNSGQPTKLISFI